MTQKHFIPRTDIGDLDNSTWMAYAVAKTSVPLGNCFTYATARISEIVGYNQSLDGTIMADGAGDLWENHHSSFTPSDSPILGALAIFKGGYDNYGHVAIVEKIEGNTIWLSQSAYRNNKDTDSDGRADGFSFVSMPARVGSYYGDYRLVGYLIHKDIQDKKSNTIIHEEEEIMSIAFVRITEDLSAKVKKGNIYLFNAGSRTYKHLNGNQYNTAKVAFPKAVTLEASKAANYFSLLSGALGASEI